MAEELLKNFQKTTLIISGNVHTSKKIMFFEKEVYSMGLYIKNKFGDFPLINLMACSGRYLNNTIKHFKDNKNIESEKFLEIGNNEYLFYLRKASPVTLF